jgi:hypothetical protein
MIHRTKNRPDYSMENNLMGQDPPVHEIHEEAIRPTESTRQSRWWLLVGGTCVYGAIMTSPYFCFAVPAISVSHFEAATHYIEAAKPMQQFSTGSYVVILIYYFPTPMVSRIIDKFFRKR